MGWLTDSGFKRQKKKQSSHNNWLIKTCLRSPPNSLSIIPHFTLLANLSSPVLGDLVSKPSLSTALSMHLVCPPFAIFSQILLNPQVRINAARSRALGLLYIVTQSLPVRGSFLSSTSCTLFGPGLWGRQ
jgi:hypothetical protein